MNRLLFGWLILVLLGPLAAQVPGPLPSLRVSPAPGVYSTPVEVAVQAPEGASVRYRFLESSGNQTFPWTESLSLGALYGETRSYTLRLTTDFPSGESQTQDYRYEISIPANQSPVVQPPPGPYTTAVSLKAACPLGWTLTLGGKPLAADAILDAEPGEKKTFLVEALGPTGERMDWTYVVDRRDQELVALDLVSPAPGSWANPQELVAAFRGMDQILWSWGDHLDYKTAKAYGGPVALDRPGVQTVTLAGRSRVDGHWTEKTVTWTNGQAEAPVDGWPTSGVFSHNLELPEADGFDLSWDDGRSWQPSTGPHQEESSPVSRKVLSVQLRKDNAVYRYVYWLDSRPPSTPLVQFFGGWNPMVTFSGSMETLHRITWTKVDGRQIEEPVSLWGPVGAWKVPDGVVGARISVQGINQLPGDPAAVGFSETGWATPTWEPWDLKGPQTGPGQLPLGLKILSRPGFWPVYEISDKPDVKEPGPHSPWLDGACFPSVPTGADRTFYMRFAWKDAGGLTGPSSTVASVRVNRIPPGPPEVTVSDDKVIVKPVDGDEPGTSVFWAVTSDRVVSADGLVFQPYSKALDLAGLRAGLAGPVWFHTRVQDREGNIGAPRLNVSLGSVATVASTSLVQVDTDPLVGEIPVTDGGIYPWPQFRLRALGTEKDLWVGVTSQEASVPDQWQSEVQPWTSLVTGGAGPGERRTFQIYWNLKTGAGWAWDHPRTLTLTLDHGPPAPISLPATWPNGPQKDPWTLVLKPSRSGDSLRYSYSTDGSTPADPVVSGDPWPGSKTWDAAPGGRVSVRVRIAAISVAGLSVECPGLDPVVIDKTVPPPVAIPLGTFTYRAGETKIPISSENSTVRYTCSTDGSVPSVPSEGSPSVPPEGLVFRGVDGQSILYRFRCRTYSASGVPGSATDTYAVLVDRTDRTVLEPLAANSKETPGQAIASPHISGLPESGVSQNPVTLTADWPTGTLHFELREGSGDPRPVTDQSPVWDRPLILDGGPGVDRSFAVSVRGFSSDGEPLTKEIQYTVRVDRAVPGAPTLELTQDSQRPEAVLKLTSAPNPEEVLWYRWFWDIYPQGSGRADWAPLGKSPPLFKAPGGSLTRLRVQAYFRDEAGNEGPISEASVVIDQNILYLKPGAAGDGTRDNPMGSVSDAVDQARRTGKSILFVALGTYPLTKTVDVGGFQIYGGLNPDLWDRTPGPTRSLWISQAPFQGKSLLESGDQDWSMGGIDLNTSGVSLDQVVFVQGAKVQVRNANWTWAGAQTGWSQFGGELGWDSVIAQYSANPDGEFLKLSTAEASVKDFELAATRNQGGELLNLIETQAIFQDLTIVSKRSQDFDAIWVSSGGQLTVNNARILGGDGASRSTGFLMKNTDATFWNTEVDLYGSSSNTVFQTSGGRLELEKSTLNLLGGLEFNQAFMVGHGNTTLRNVQLKVGSGSYQGGFSVDGGTLSLETCLIELAGGGKKVWGAQFTDTCHVTLQDVTWDLETKTPGELWILQKPWDQDSSVTGSQTPGW